MSHSVTLPPQLVDVIASQDSDPHDHDFLLYSVLAHPVHKLMPMARIRQVIL